MNDQSAIIRQAKSHSLPMRTAIGQPVSIGGLAAMLHPSSGDTAVVFFSPWGFEELCSRKTFRLMAERLAQCGFTALRFDYPDTGDSAPLGDATPTWLEAAEQAVRFSETQCGAKKIILVGQGVGGLLAAKLAARVNTIAGLALLAPTNSGRSHLRELAAWTSFTQQTFLVSPTQGPEGSLTAAGFVMPADATAEIRKLNLMKGGLPEGLPVLLVKRPDHPGDDALEEHLRDGGANLSTAPFDGYSLYVSDPTLSEVPEAAIDALAGWAKANVKSGQSAAAGPYPSGALPAAAATVIPGVREERLRFADGDTLFGVLASPADRQAETAVIFLNSGYDHHIGWARSHVELARELAAEGFASLRMDASGIGESPHWPGQGSQILYSQTQVGDVKAAVDLLAGRGFTKIAVAGRCSGAYLALLAAADDPRIGAMAMINSRRFAWNPRQDVDHEIRKPVQPLKNYQRKLRDRSVLKRAFSSPKAFREALGKFLRGVSRPMMRKLAPLLGPLSMHNRLDRLVHRRMKALRDRGCHVALIYSENDPGLEELDAYFGQDRKRLDGYANTKLIFVPDADHNMTPPHAREALHREIVNVLNAIER